MTVNERLAAADRAFELTLCRLKTRALELILEIDDPDLQATAIRHLSEDEAVCRGTWATQARPGLEARLVDQGGAETSLPMRPYDGPPRPPGPGLKWVRIETLEDAREGIEHNVQKSLDHLAEQLALDPDLTREEIRQMLRLSEPKLRVFCEQQVLEALKRITQ